MVSDQAGSVAAPGGGRGSSSLASHFTRREYRRPLAPPPPQEEEEQEPPSPPAPSPALLEGTAAAPADGGQQGTQPPPPPPPKGKKAKAKAKAKARATPPQLAPETEALLTTDENRRKFKVITRLTSKLQDKRKTFSFGFEVGGGDEQQETPADGASANAAEEDEIDRLVRELGGEAAGAKAKGRKEKKRQQAKQQEQGAAASPSPAANTAKQQAAEEPAPEPSPVSTGPPAETGKESQSAPKPDLPPAAAMSTPERNIPLGPPPGLAKPLGPPPGLPEPEKKKDGATHQRQQPQQRKAQGRWAQGPPAAVSTRKGREQPPLVQFQSWRDSGLSEEERLRKRLGQGLRNMEAIAKRSQQHKAAVGVIGGEGSIWTPDRAKGPADAAALDAVTTAFSFGFAI